MTVLRLLSLAEALASEDAAAQRKWAPKIREAVWHGLYWLVAKESRRLERVFTIEDGRQRWW